MDLSNPNKTVFSKTFYAGRRVALAKDNNDFNTLFHFRKKRKEEKRGIIEHLQLLNEIDLNIKTNNKNLSVLCACFIPEYDIIMVSGTNNTITAWHFSKSEILNLNATSEYILTKEEKKLAILIANQPQSTIIWDPQLKCLFTGQKDGKILKWELTNPYPIFDDTLDVNIVRKKIQKINQTEKENNYKEETNIFQKYKDKASKYKEKINSILLEDKKKNLSVSCLLMLKKLQLLAASYYNGYIILWDTLLKEYRKCYYDQTTGVYYLAYDSFRNLLFTCGLNHDIYVYDPYIDCSSVFKLSGHTCSITMIDINEKESELISLDIGGNVKIWDTTTLVNFQSFKINEEDEDYERRNQQKILKNKKQKIISILKMVYFQKLKKIFIYGDKTLFFEADRSNCPDLADDQAICSCYYDYESLNLISFCLRKIKFWNLLTGKVRMLYDDPMGSEMTAIAVDKTCKRAYLGDNYGKIKNINLRNGLILKNLESHSTEIKFLIHSSELNLVASCSVDNIIKIHNNKELFSTEVIKEIKIIDNNITSLCFLDTFWRLCIGLANGMLKFYDIEHFHYDSDLEVDSSSIKGELTVMHQIQGLEIVLCSYSTGNIKLIVTPPSNAKYKIIHEFSTNKDNNSIPVSCIEFDNANHHMFLGDILGNIFYYDISNIYEIYKTIPINNKKQFSSDGIINKENYTIFKNLTIKNIWKIEAHKEAIRHIHYVNVTPRIIITTSYDLKIKIFSADNGKFKDEFKQIANRIKPVPIGIKYYLLDPFGEKDNKYGPKYLYRKDVADFNGGKIKDSNNQQIAEVAKRITEYNAREKLWLTTRNTNLPDNMSNDWKLNINIEKIKEKEEKNIQDLLNKVKAIEKITKETESILINQSIYSELYKPKYIEEMNDMDKIKELSKNIQERLRNVKLAVSRANQNYNKMVELSKKQKKADEKLSNLINKRRKFKSALCRNFSYKNSKIPLIDENFKIFNTKKINNNEIKEKIESAKDNTNIVKEKEKDLTLKKMTNRKVFQPSKTKNILPGLKSQYAMDRTKLITPGDHFNKYQIDFSEGYKAIFQPFKKLVKKAKKSQNRLSRVKSSILYKRNNNKLFDENSEKSMMPNNKKFLILEKCLKKLEQNISV